MHASSQPKPSALHVDLSAILKDTGLLYPFLQVLVTVMEQGKTLPPVSQEEWGSQPAPVRPRRGGLQQEDDGEEGVTQVA